MYEWNGVPSKQEALGQLPIANCCSKLNGNYCWHKQWLLMSFLLLLSMIMVIHAIHEPEKFRQGK